MLLCRHFQFCRTIRTKGRPHLNGLVALRADRMKKALALGAVVECRTHRRAALWARAPHGLPDHEVDDEPNRVGNNEHQNRPDRRVHSPALGVAIDVTNEKYEEE